jgi:hypothetical protein
VDAAVGPGLLLVLGDLLDHQETLAVEIKLTSNPSSSLIDRLNRTADLIDASRRILVCRIARRIETDRLL